MTLTAPLTATTAAALPVAQLVIGKPVEEVVELIPRLFNLCRGSQDVAIRLALGLPLEEAMRPHLAEDFVRDHLLRLGVILPRQLGLDPLPIAQGGAWFLPQQMPTTLESFEAYLESGAGFSPVFKRLHDVFGTGEAVANLPLVADEDLPRAQACENSIAARHFVHPLMLVVQRLKGRGPLWRAVARLLDLEACLTKELPKARRLENGWAIVPASRGIYALRAQAKDGVVSRFERVTPTDHMLAPNGILAQSLASLPGGKHHLAGLVLDCLDPCSPVTLRGGLGHA
ncbi:MAG: hydrogenase expression/formation protein HupK [Pseudodonghicola sp.]|nr:hydrogenase expression/formation protein HupK [Pseudodonghicola sp.]